MAPIAGGGLLAGLLPYAPKVPKPPKPPNPNPVEGGWLAGWFPPEKIPAPVVIGPNSPPPVFAAAFYPPVAAPAVP